MTRRALDFVVLGGLLFTAARWCAEPPLAPITGGAVDADELLYRAALARGLDRDDPVLLGRLIRNMRFLGAVGADGELSGEARAVGLADTDLVIRRRLIERMRLQLEAAATADEPSDAELQAYLDAHAEQFAEPARVVLTQVFVSGRGADAAVRAAERLRTRLSVSDVEGAPALGDPLPLPSAMTGTRDDLARLLGDDFAAAVFRLEPGGWRGPIRSPYGLHLVWLHERRDSALPALETVRDAVRASLRESRARAAVADGVRTLRGTHAR